MESVKLRDLPLGSLFRYMDGTPKVYVLLSCAGSGLVADNPAEVRGPRPFQGLYSAAESRQEFEKLQVLPVVTQPAPHPVAQGEPVAWYVPWNDDGVPKVSLSMSKPDRWPSARPLVFGDFPQPVSEPSDEELIALWGMRSDGPDNHEILSYARAVLALRPSAPRAPLTDEQIDRAIAAERDALLDYIYEYGTNSEGVLRLVRKLARRAHGISQEVGV